MAYRVAIVDDSTTDTEFVQGILNSWADQRHASIQAEVFPSAEAFMFRYAEDKEWDILLLDKEWDILLLDIEMGAMDGVTMAKRVRQDTMILKNIGGLIVYLTILSRMDTILLLVVIATCVAGFFVSRYTNNWRYARREEEENYFQKKYYLRAKSESVELAKDIRIFGLQNWLNELLDQIHNLYLDFTAKRTTRSLMHCRAEKSDMCCLRHTGVRA